MDNFIGWSLAEKVEMLRGLQEARLTGRVARAETAMRVGTQFDLKDTNITQLLRGLEDSILADPALPEDSPIRAQLEANRRPGVTLQSHY